LEKTLGMRQTHPERFCMTKSVSFPFGIRTNPRLLLTVLARYAPASAGAAFSICRARSTSFLLPMYSGTR